MNVRRTALAAVIAGLVVAIPTTVKINDRDQRIETEQANSRLLQSNIRELDSDLFWSRTRDALNADALRRNAEEIGKLRQQNEQLQRDVRDLRVQRQAVVKPTTRPGIRANAGTRTMTGNCESYRSLVAAYFPPAQVNNALLTMRKESGCRPRAVSPAGDHGLMQINYRSHRGKVGSNVAVLYDPETNIRIAAQIYRESG